MKKQDYRISKEELANWCSIPMRQLSKHIKRKTQLQIYSDNILLNEALCNALVDELLNNNAARMPTRWILPCHVGMFEHMIRRINVEKISMRNVHIFHMDEFLDWQGRPLPEKKTFTSCKGTMQAEIYNRIDAELNVPASQRHFPDVRDPDSMDLAIETLGGVDTLVGGVGCKGMVAFCEAPRSAYYRISIDEYAQSKTRIVQILDDTIVAYAVREFGGCYDAVPPMAITIGMKSMLQSKRALLVISTGSWKQTVIRVAMFSKPTVEYPVTLLTNTLPCTILTNEASADHVLSHSQLPDSLM